MSGTQDAAVKLPEAPPKNAPWYDIGGFIRRFLCSLIVDILVEFYARYKSDPIFQKRLTETLGKLDAAATPAQNDEAITELQDLVGS